MCRSNEVPVHSVDQTRKVNTFAAMRDKPIVLNQECQHFGTWIVFCLQYLLDGLNECSGKYLPIHHERRMHLLGNLFFGSISRHRARRLSIRFASLLENYLGKDAH